MITNQWSRCESTHCLDARRSGAYVEIRNSNDKDGPRIWLPVAEWLYMIDAIRAGQPVPQVEADETSDTITFVRVTEIEFTRTEWDTFTTSVRDGGFDLETS